jgi:hypothetical protein
MTDAPVPGTVAHEAVQYLRTHHEATTAALALGLGRSAKRLAQHLAPAVRAGILSRRIEAGFAFWRLGANADDRLAPAVTGPEITRVSALSAPSVFAYADQRGAAAFSASLSTDGRLVVERFGRVLMELTNTERLVLIQAAQGVIA